MLHEHDLVILPEAQIMNDRPYITRICPVDFLMKNHKSIICKISKYIEINRNDFAELKS